MQAKELETELDAAFIEVEYQISVDSCKDHDVSPWLGLAFMVFTRLKHCNISLSLMHPLRAHVQGFCVWQHMYLPVVLHRKM